MTTPAEVKALIKVAKTVEVRIAAKDDEWTVPITKKVALKLIDDGCPIGVLYVMADIGLVVLG